MIAGQIDNDITNKEILKILFLSIQFGGSMVVGVDNAKTTTQVIHRVLFFYILFFFPSAAGKKNHQNKSQFVSGPEV